MDSPFKFPCLFHTSSYTNTAWIHLGYITSMELPKENNFQDSTKQPHAGKKMASISGISWPCTNYALGYWRLLQMGHFQLKLKSNFRMTDMIAMNGTWIMAIIYTPIPKVPGGGKKVEFIWNSPLCPIHSFKSSMATRNFFLNYNIIRLFQMI